MTRHWIAREGAIHSRLPDYFVNVCQLRLVTHATADEAPVSFARR